MGREYDPRLFGLALQLIEWGEYLDIWVQVNDYIGSGVEKGSEQPGFHRGAELSDIVHCCHSERLVGLDPDVLEAEHIERLRGLDDLLVGIINDQHCESRRWVMFPEGFR